MIAETYHIPGKREETGTFVVEADSREEACVKIRQGEYDSFQPDGNEYSYLEED